jgi:hypothetical protein
MNLDALHKKLIAVARANPPSDAVPYAFEKRIMARLAGQPVPDLWAGWARAFTRAAALCVIVSAGLIGWSYYSAGEKNESLSQDVEKTLYAAVDPGSAADLMDDGQ